MKSFAAKVNRGTLAIGCLVMAAIIVLSVNFISANVFRQVKADLTEDRLYTIAQGTQQTVQKIDEPIDVRLYYSKQLGELAPTYAKYFDRVRGLLEQYRDMSAGKLRVTYLDPEPFSDTEDRAVAAGLRGIRLNLEGDKGYFGLVATNSTDNQEVIEFFSPDRERFLEYDLTKVVHTLANPKKLQVGLISNVPLIGGMTPQGQHQPQWYVMNQIQEFFDVLPLDQDLKEVPEMVDLLMVVQPDKMTKQAAYAIDQFVLNGGRILAFVDPVFESGQPTPFAPKTEPSGEFDKLLSAWGVEFDRTQVASDVANARRVQFGGGTQPTITEHIAWLALGNQNLDEGDVLSSGIDRINVATPGYLEKAEGKPAKFQPILQTSPLSMSVDADEFGFASDPVKLLRNFRAGDKPLTLAARISGKVSSAFPDGPPQEGDAQKKDASEVPQNGTADASKDSKTESHTIEGEINAIVVADADMLHDQFWVNVNDFFGQRILIPNAHNATFVLNALDNLSGSSELISLRGRGVDDRPFELVEGLRKDAERRFRRKEEALVARLENVQKELATIEKKGDGGDAILSEKDKKAIEAFRNDMIRIRRELREVKRALREDIDVLEGTVKFANIAGVPLLIALGGLAVVLTRRRRRHGN